MSTVYTGGTFDVLHAGHVDLLEVCRVIAGDGQVVVGLNRDEFVKKFKGKAPVCSYSERKMMLESCRYVDKVVENEGDEDSRWIITKVKPDFIVIGDDWAKKNYYAQMQFTPQWLMDRRIVLLYVARLRELSSTQIKERCRG